MLPSWSWDSFSPSFSSDEAEIVHEERWMSLSAFHVSPNEFNADSIHSVIVRVSLCSWPEFGRKIELPSEIVLDDMVLEISVDGIPRFQISVREVSGDQRFHFIAKGSKIIAELKQGVIEDVELTRLLTERAVEII